MASLMTRVEWAAPARMTRAQAWAFIEPTRVALQRLLDGVGSHQDVATVGMAYNMAYLRCAELKDTEAQEWFDMAGAALEAMDEGDPPAAPSEAQHHTLCVAVNRYDALVRGCSHDGWLGYLDQLMKIALEPKAA